MKKKRSFIIFTPYTDWAMKNWTLRFKLSPYKYKIAIVADRPNYYDPKISERIIVGNNYLNNETHK